MENKKNPKANLEKFKTLFLGTGFILSIIILISVFKYETLTAVSEFRFDPGVEEEEMIQITRDDIKMPPPPLREQRRQQTIEIMNLIDNDKNIEDEEFEIPEFKEGDEINFTNPEEDDDNIFIFVEKMPEPLGGYAALQKYIMKNVRYPAVAKENCIEGTVFLRFEVTETGKIGKVELQKGVDPLLDNEAIKVIKSLPKFKPGEQNGKKVRVWISVPVTFRLI